MVMVVLLENHRHSKNELDKCVGVKNNEMRGEQINLTMEGLGCSQESLTRKELGAG